MINFSPLRINRTHIFLAGGKAQVYDIETGEENSVQNLKHFFRCHWQSGKISYSIYT